MPESYEGVIVGVVVVPGKTLRMDKDGGGGKSVVAIDEVSGSSLIGT